jgi:hypothetical protein
VSGRPGDEARERLLREYGRTAAGGRAPGQHPDEPLLALLRNGDHGEDIADAIGHVARCADCRARLIEGDVGRRNVVVMAIEAPRASHSALAKAAETSSARLVERGQGRWTAVVDAENAAQLKDDLVKGEASVVSRLVVTTPLQVPREEVPTGGGRARLKSLTDVPMEVGTGAAEVQAWAQIPRAPRKKVPGPNPGWVLFAIAAVVGAVVIAYLLAIR